MDEISDNLSLTQKTKQEVKSHPFLTGVCILAGIVSAASPILLFFVNNSFAKREELKYQKKETIAYIDKRDKELRTYFKEQNTDLKKSLIRINNHLMKIYQRVKK